MATSTDGYSLLTTINLPGSVGGHGDIVAFDPATADIWIAQSPDDNVVVIDTATNGVRAVIPNIGNANGIALTSQYAFVADVTNNTTDVIDKQTFKVVATVAQTGTTPDGVVYVPTTDQVLVASDDANVEDFINAKAPFTQTASLQLQPDPAVSGPDVATYVPSKDLIFQPDDQQLDVVNPHTAQVVAAWHLLTTGSVKPLVYDPQTNHFLVGTTSNQLLVVDGDSGAVLKTIAVSGSVDQASIDIGARLAFFGDKAGVADIINLDTGQLVGGLPAEKNMHTLAVDTANHDIYVYENNRNTVDVYTHPDPAHAPEFGVLSHDVHSVAGEVYALYEGLLGRAPDPLGGESWASALSSGASVQDVTKGIQSSTEAQTHLNASDNAGYVEQVYETVLGRQGDSSGSQSWVVALNSGLSRTDLVDNFVFSSEHVGDLQPGLDAGVFVADATDASVARLYHGLLGRGPDAGGLQSWETSAHNGTSLATISDALLASPEHQADHAGAQTNQQFVDGLYIGALGRAADTTGEQSWTHLLDSGTTRAQVAVAISESVEAQQHLVSQVEVGWHFA